MDQLSQELIDLIVDYLPGRLSHYSTITRRFQAAVERRNFVEIRLECTQLEFFDSVFRTRARQANLTNLEYQTTLPVYPDTSYGSFETKEEQDANNIIFTESVSALFDVLASWQRSPTSKTQKVDPWILLKLSVFSPADVPFRSTPTVPQTNPVVGDLKELRYKRNFLKIVSAKNLAKVHVVNIFKFWGSSISETRDIEPSSMMELIQRLPGLNEFDLSFNDDEWRYPSLQERRHSDFCRQISALNSEFLDWIHLNFEQRCPMNHNYDIANRRKSTNWGPNQLSITLHRLSQAPNLTYLDIAGVALSPSIFWPQTSSLESPPCWPRLAYFSVKIEGIDSYCNWLYERPTDPVTGGNQANLLEESLDFLSEPVDATSEEDIDAESGDELEYIDEYHPARQLDDEESGRTPYLPYRTAICASKFEPFIFAMANASTRMPRIQRLTLENSARGRSRVAINWFGSRNSSHQTSWVIRKQEQAQWEVSRRVIKYLETTAAKPHSVSIESM